MHESERVGGVLFDASDPEASAGVLAELLLADQTDEERARAFQLEPVLVESLRRSLPLDRESIELACARGVAWVLGRRSSNAQDSWEPVASLPMGAVIPAGLRRTTGETLIGLAASALRRIRLAAPHLDESGIGVLADVFAAATRRGVDVEIFYPMSWEPAHAAIAAVRRAISEGGDARRLALYRASEDAPFSHLKVMVVDDGAAYIGSANVTGAGLVGRNLELGVIVRGSEVAVISGILDTYQVRS